MLKHIIWLSPQMLHCLVGRQLIWGWLLIVFCQNNECMTCRVCCCNQLVPVKNCYEPLCFLEWHSCMTSHNVVKILSLDIFSQNGLFLFADDCYMCCHLLITCFLLLKTFQKGNVCDEVVQNRPCRNPVFRLKNKILEKNMPFIVLS